MTRQHGYFGPMRWMRAIDLAADRGIIGGPIVPILGALIRAMDWDTGVVVLSLDALARRAGYSTRRTARAALEPVLQNIVNGDQDQLLRELVKLEREGKGKGQAHILRVDLRALADLAIRLKVPTRDDPDDAPPTETGTARPQGAEITGTTRPQGAEITGTTRPQGAEITGTTRPQSRDLNGRAGSFNGRAEGFLMGTARPLSGEINQDTQDGSALAGASGAAAAAAEVVVDSVRVKENDGQTEYPDWATPDRRRTIERVSTLLSKKHRKLIRAAGCNKVADSIALGVLTLEQLDTSPADRLADRLAGWARREVRA